MKGRGEGEGGEWRVVGQRKAFRAEVLAFNFLHIFVDFCFFTWLHWVLAVACGI